MIYLDNNATTPVAPEVREAMLPFLGPLFANPSSPYTPARAVAAALARAREQVAALLDARPTEIVFTSGGTEGNNAALSAALDGQSDRREIISTTVEHPSVLVPLHRLERAGYVVHYAPVDSEGRLDMDFVKDRLSSRTALVSVMMANNETGVLFPVDEVAALARGQGALFHTDAVQAAGKIPLRPGGSSADFLTISGHKFHGPKGVGALCVRSGIPFPALLKGGGQEYGRRGGTENVAGIVGMGVAATQALEQLGEMEARVRGLRDELETAIRAQVAETRVVGSSSRRLPNTALILTAGIEADAALALLDVGGVCCSSGSACAAGSPEPSHVLRAMGIPPAEADSAIRFSLSRWTSAGDIARAAETFVGVVQRLRAGKRN
jgi:cysteine desulfurase